MPFALTPERDRELSEILTRYPNKMAACIPALHLCQDQHGWISDEVVDYVSKKLDLPSSHVKGVVTFYTLFNQHPVGKHQVWVCRTLPCALRGAGDVLAQCEKKLGIKPGETTKDGKVTLRTAECLASCGTAPMMQVDRDYHENLTTADVDKILDGLIAGRPVAPKLAPPMPPIDKAAPAPPAPPPMRPHAATLLGTAPQANAPVTEAKTESKSASEKPAAKTPSDKPAAATPSPIPPPRPDIPKSDVSPIAPAKSDAPAAPAVGVAGAGANIGAGAAPKDPLKGTMLGMGSKQPPPPPIASPVAGSVKPPGGSVPPPPLPNRASAKPPPVPPKPLSVPPKPLDEEHPDEEEKTKKGES
jgi:NADH-quinone oxidoreductase subunit E